MATVSMSLATRSNDLDDQKSGVYIEIKGHTLTPPSSQNGPEETEAVGGMPSHSPSQSPARKPTLDHPETQYCLEIQVISTEYHHPHTPGRCQLWKTWSGMVNSA